MKYHYLIFLFIFGCAKSYKPPEAGKISTITFKSSGQEYRDVTISRFKDFDCSDWPGEKIAKLNSSDLLSKQIDSISIDIPAEDDFIFSFHFIADFEAVSVAGMFGKSSYHCEVFVRLKPTQHRKYFAEYGVVNQQCTSTVYYLYNGEKRIDPTTKNHEYCTPRPR